jgi:hypothetical protein
VTTTVKTNCKRAPAHPTRSVARASVIFENARWLCIRDAGMACLLNVCRSV